MLDVSIFKNSKFIKLMEFVDEVRLKSENEFESVESVSVQGDQKRPESLFEELLIVLGDKFTARADYEYLKDHVTYDTSFYDVKNQVEMLRRDMNTTAHNLDEFEAVNKNKLKTLKHEVRDAFELAMAKTDISEFIQVRDKLKDLTPLRDFKRMRAEITDLASKEEVLDVKTRLDRMAKTDDVLKKLEEVIAEFECSKATFVVKDDFSETFKNIDESMDGYQLFLEKIKNDIKGIKSEIKMYAQIMDKKSDRKAVDEHFKQVWANFQKYCAFEHLREFKDQINPIVDNCKADVMKCLRICKENESVILRFDEIICSKASKFSIDKLYQDIKVFVQKEDFEAFQALQKCISESLESNIESVKTNLASTHIQISQELREMMEEIAKQVKKALISELGGSPIDSRELARLLILKADKSEVEQGLKKKADVGHINFNDKKIKRLQDQLQQLLLVFIGMLKTSLSKKSFIPLNEKSNDAAELLNQIYSIYMRFCNVSKEDLDKLAKVKHMDHSVRLDIDSLKLPSKAASIVKRGRKALSPDLTKFNKSFSPSASSQNISFHRSKKSTQIPRILDETSNNSLILEESHDMKPKLRKFQNLQKSSFHLPSPDSFKFEIDCRKRAQNDGLL